MSSKETKVPKCPDCSDGGDVLKIIWGYPTEELLEESKKGTFILGGCCPEPGINFQCKKCKKKIGEPIEQMGLQN